MRSSTVIKVRIIWWDWNVLSSTPRMVFRWDEQIISGNDTERVSCSYLQMDNWCCRVCHCLKFSENLFCINCLCTLSYVFIQTAPLKLSHAHVCIRQWLNVAVLAICLIRLEADIYLQGCCIYFFSIYNQVTWKTWLIQVLGYHFGYAWQGNDELTLFNTQVDSSKSWVDWMNLGLIYKISKERNLILNWTSILFSVNGPFFQWEIISAIVDM